MSFGVDEILAWIGGRVVNGAALSGSLAQTRVKQPASLAGSGPEDVAFFFAPEYQSELPLAKPGILITAPPFCQPLESSGLPLWRSAVVIACEDPYLAMAILSEKFAPLHSTVAHQERPLAFRHPLAWVSPEARIGQNVRIDAHCTIEAGAEVGDGTVIYPGVSIGPKARVGQDCVLFSHVSIYEMTQIGDRVRIHANSVIGSDGFGYAPRREGKQVVGHQKIFHFGRVIVGDDAEIGACVTIDRGTFKDTWIGKNVKLDNQVHIGHNVRLDEGAVICGGTCFAGNSSAGRYVYVGGLTGVNNRVHLGDGSKVGALTIVTKDIPPGGDALGTPQRGFREHLQVHAFLNRLYAGRRKKDEK